MVGEDPERIATFHFLKSDMDDGEYSFSMSFRLQSDVYREGSLKGSGVEMMQDLRVWITKPEDQLVLRYQWLGGAVQQPGLEGGRARIEVPPSSYHLTPRQPMWLEIELTLLDSGGFEADTGPDFRSNTPRGNPAAQDPKQQLKELETKDLAFAGSEDFVGAG